MGQESVRQGRGGGEMDGMVLGDGVGVVVGLPEPVCFGALQNRFWGHDDLRTGGEDGLDDDEDLLRRRGHCRTHCRAGSVKGQAVK